MTHMPTVPVMSNSSAVPQVPQVSGIYPGMPTNNNALFIENLNMLKEKIANMEAYMQQNVSIKLVYIVYRTLFVYL